MQPIKSPANLRKQRVAKRFLNSQERARRAIWFLRHVCQEPYQVIAYKMGYGELMVRKMEKGDSPVSTQAGVALVNYLNEKASELSHKDFDEEADEFFNQSIIDHLDALAEVIK